MGSKKYPLFLPPLSRGKKKISIIGSYIELTPAPNKTEGVILPADLIKIRGKFLSLPLYIREKEENAQYAIQIFL